VVVGDEGGSGSTRRGGLDTEPWVLRHSLEVLLVGGSVALVAFGVAYGLEGGREFGPRFEVGLRAATGVAALIAGLLTWGRLELSRLEHRLAAEAEAHRFEAEQERLVAVASEQRLAGDRDLTERFGRSVEQLGSADPLVRTGGVYALERFALDAVARTGEERDVDWRMALDLLATFARERSAVASVHGSSAQAVTRQGSEDLSAKARIDHGPAEVIDAVRVLGRFAKRAGRTLEVRYDLAGVNLRGANLRFASLRAADLHAADFTGADLTAADLTKADLHDADLTAARLGDADLTGARLNGAVLRGTYVTGATLTDSHLTGADLRAASLIGANMVNASWSTQS
jgi:Pentapeptide repeats (8 copies)